MTTKIVVFLYISKEEGTKLYIDFLKEIFLILADFFNFFESRNDGFSTDDQRKLNLISRIEKINDVFEYLLNQESLNPIFERLNINKNNYKELQVQGDLIFLLAILGGFDHIGAEWPKENEPGKYNQLRERLGLEKLLEVPPGVFVERFNLSNNDYDTLFIRFLFGDIRDLIYAASIQGKDIGLFSPVDPVLRQRIRVIDFYLRFKNFCELIDNDKLILKAKTLKILIREYLNTFLRTKLSDEDFANLTSIIDEFFGNKLEKELKITSAINEINNLAASRFNYKNLILIFMLKNLLMEKIMRKYLEIEDDENDENDELYYAFINMTKDVKTLELRTLESKEFGGIKLPINVGYLTSDDLFRIYYLREYFLPRLKGQG